MRALIVGAGTMGRWFAELTRDWVTVAFADADRAAARRAAEDFDGEVVDPTVPDRFAIVCTAVPLAATVNVIAEVGPMAERAIIDLSGTMGKPLVAMRSHTSECERISLHPLFAPENAPGNVAMVAENSGRIAVTLRDLLEREEYTPFETTAEDHDRAMENVQAKVHAAVLAYALAAEPVEEAFHTPVSSSLSELVEHVLAGTPRVYADIQTRYRGAEAVATAAANVAAADEEAFVDLFHEARDRRSDDGT